MYLTESIMQQSPWYAQLEAVLPPKGYAAMSFTTFCPVCGFDLDFEAWSNDSPSNEICSCCGMQFGYYDATPGGPVARAVIYAKWREQWTQAGMPWRSGDQPPADWNPVHQLLSLLKGNTIA